MKLTGEFRFGWLADLALAGLLLITSGSAAADATKPNVLFILADDFPAGLHRCIGQCAHPNPEPR